MIPSKRDKESPKAPATGCNLPCAVPKPVRSTTARQPPSGVLILALLSPLVCSSLVPPNSTCIRSRLMDSLHGKKGNCCRHARKAEICYHEAWQLGKALGCHCRQAGRQRPAMAQVAA